jgi:hypothetical protein
MLTPNSEGLKKYINDPIEFPRFIPSDIEKVNHQIQHEEPVYDPSIHLDICPPGHIIDLNFERQPFPPWNHSMKNFAGLAFTAPFKVLSAEGVSAVRSIVNNHSNNPFLKRSNSRIPAFYRGFGYVSQFLRDLNECKVLKDLYSQISGEKVGIHTMPMNFAHVNVGEVGLDRPVDSWYAFFHRSLFVLLNDHHEYITKYIKSIGTLTLLIT